MFSPTLAKASRFVVCLAMLALGLFASPQGIAYAFAPIPLIESLLPSDMGTLLASAAVETGEVAAVGAGAATIEVTGPVLLTGLAVYLVYKSATSNPYPGNHDYIYEQGRCLAQGSNWQQSGATSRSVPLEIPADGTIPTPNVDLQPACPFGLQRIEVIRAKNCSGQLTNDTPPIPYPCGSYDWIYTVTPPQVGPGPGNVPQKYGDCTALLVAGATCHTIPYMRKPDGSQVNCLEHPDACTGYTMKPEGGVQTRPEGLECHYGNVVIAVSDCDPYADPITKADPTTDPNPNPTPTNPDPNPTPTPSAGPTTPPDPSGDPAPNPDPENCLGSSLSWNPVTWVLAPIKCALKWAFIPPAGTMTQWTEKANDIKNKPPVNVMTGGITTITSVTDIWANCLPSCAGNGATYGFPVPNTNITFDPISSAGDTMQNSTKGHAIYVLGQIAIISGFVWWAWRRIASSFGGKETT